MKTGNTLGIVLCIGLMVLGLNCAHSQNNQQLEGIWVGDMIVNKDLSLKMAFELIRAEDQSLLATMNSIDQGAFDIPVDSVSFENGQLSLVVNSLNSSYGGKLVDATSMKGNFTQAGNKPWELNLKKVDEMPGGKPKRPQEPHKPYSYQEEDITYVNTDAGVTLAGTLTKPATGGPFPAILLVPGSGPSDRNQHIFGHKVFLVLADYLTRQGFAVLRVDDRGVGLSTGSFSRASVEDLASDARAGVKYLKGRRDIISNQVGLLGHSQGGEIAPLAAVQSQNVNFIVLLAASGLSLEKNIYEQCKAVYTGMGLSQKGIDLNERILKACFDVVRVEKDNSHAKQKIADKLKLFDREVALLSKQELAALELKSPLDPTDYYSFLSSVMRIDLFHNPKIALEKLKCPVLAINGSFDLQVLPHNLEVIGESLKQGGNTNCTIKLFPGKNHLFQSCKTGAIDEYKKIEETMAPEVQEYISKWLKRTVSAL